MEILAVQNLKFTYPGMTEPALSHISLSVQAGAFITVCGKSGCGKTTLLRLLKPTLSPHGIQEGTVRYKGQDITALSHRAQTEEIGFVLQNPDSQIVTDTVWHELAFGLESLGVPTGEIRTRVAEMASFFGIQTWFHEKVERLSGGQKQLLNLAAVMLLRPSLLLLDEPTSQLDPVAAGQFIRMLEKINRELGTTVILCEHRTEEAFSVSDRVIVMEDGRLLADAPPSAVGTFLAGHEIAGILPTPLRIYMAVEGRGTAPVTVREGREWLENRQVDPAKIPKAKPPVDTEPVVEAKDIFFRYEKNGPDILRSFSATVRKGEIFAIVGGNGVGKTTALSVMAGLLSPYRGKVRVVGKIGVLPQNPQTLFTQKTVYEELTALCRDTQKLERVVTLCRIGDILDRHPFDVSGGEMERTALAKVLLTDPAVLFMDEPTKGMDGLFKKQLAEILRSADVTTVMVSHDIEFCAEYADRCAMFFDGNIVAADEPRAFFAGKSFYTTAASRMAQTCLPEAVLCGDVIAALGGIEEKPKPPAAPMLMPPVPPEEPSPFPAVSRGKIKKKIALAFVLLAVPITILLGFYGRKPYYFISLLLLLEIMVPFALSFEGRKPSARELMLVSVLCAIGVAGRAAFYMLPQFKPVAALVILAGVALGGETGFLVGAVTAFVSNFFFGQGPWTPWQMLALGSIGFLAGVPAQRDLLGKTRLALSLFGGIITFLVYGGIMNLSSLLLWQPNPTVAQLWSAFTLGAPFDAIHALSTAFFLWLAGGSVLEKLERVKTKYGFMQ
ncbi:MAG: ATP-binding cassette domain-containing protein [Ruminococcaceae bacterium]|nr:ATP-binding cassette domain-containing protein [Oscillospiraceae bacterium]